MLQHYPKELKADLRNQDSWKAAENTRSAIAILLLIYDLSLNKMGRKRSIMATVEADTDLYLSMQRPDQSTDDFYKTFTAQGDTINANGGSAGFHNGVYKKHMMDLWDRDLVTAKLLVAMSPAKKLALDNCLQKEATESSCEDCLVCLFLLLADEERFKTVTTKLNNNYLLRKQE